MNVLCTFNLRPVSTEDLHALEVKAIEYLKVSFLQERRYAHFPFHSHFRRKTKQNKKITPSEIPNS